MISGDKIESAERVTCLGIPYAAHIPGYVLNVIRDMGLKGAIVRRLGKSKHVFQVIFVGFGYLVVSPIY